VRRLMSIPGIGPICATALEALAPPPETFVKGRDFAAWLGLVPRQHSSAGKARLGRVSKMGQRDLRRLLIIGAMSVGRPAEAHQPVPGSHACWRGSRECWWLLHWPTKWRVSRGHCSPEVRIIELLLLRPYSRGPPLEMSSDVVGQGGLWANGQEDGVGRTNEMGGAYQRA
jgi:hypothetical protein